MKIFVLLMLMISQSWAFDRVSVMTSAGHHEQQLAADVARFWRIGDSKFMWGVGVRGTSQWASDTGFTTAPSLLTTGQEGPHTIFLSDKKENIDDLRIQTSQVTSINIAAHLLYVHSSIWSFGTNIDVIGGSFGKRVKAKYTPKSDASSYPSDVSARPTPLNLLLISDNDHGSLNSEFYARQDIGGGWGLKYALNFVFSEYTTTQRLRKNNDRFRHKALLPSFGVTRDF
ncbi:MAG: hypothetical protein K2P81_10220 [Bacteriovoracaceae bacterium]|nr:hypothetical protein [Bacteriovoracaceae bacterium]